MIIVKNLSFSYENAVDDLRGKVKPVLDNLNITFDKATTTAIVGESGSGKSTILKLLNKTYKVERLDHLSKEQLRDCIKKMKMLRDRAS